jgi:hypothetical protein
VLAVPVRCAANVRLEGVKLSVLEKPVPLRATFCGLPVALSAMLRFALSDPVALGLKVIETEQLRPAASEAGQVLAEIA